MSKSSSTGKVAQRTVVDNYPENRAPYKEKRINISWEKDYLLDKCLFLRRWEMVHPQGMLFLNDIRNAGAPNEKDFFPYPVQEDVVDWWSRVRSKQYKEVLAKRGSIREVCRVVYMRVHNAFHTGSEKNPPAEKHLVTGYWQPDGSKEHPRIKHKDVWNESADIYDRLATK